MNILNPKKIKADVSDRRSRPTFWISTFILLSLSFLAAYILLDLNVFPIFGDYLKHLKKGMLWTASSFAILAVSRIIERAITGSHPSPATRYNLIRMMRLLAIVMIMVVGASLLFENWYTAAVSLGLISLLAGFALQTPITTLIGWLYIVIRTPYHVGERIQIDSFRGDVVEISYLDTTLWEFGGDYLTNDLPSGRLIRFPNSLVLQSPVFNYSWDTFPYLWNEIPFHFAYESDLKAIEEVIKRVAKAELEQNADEKIENLKKYMENTPVSEVDIKEYPFVAFRIHVNTWVEATVTYLVSPKKAADTRSRIVKKILAELNKIPDKALFPKSNAR
jgi:small-conductance mechanosensitive channel